MSRRKQTKPLHLQSDSDEELKDEKVKKDGAKAIPGSEDPSQCTPAQSAATLSTTAENSKVTIQATQLRPDSNSSSKVADSRSGTVQETPCSKDEEPGQTESQAKASTPDVTLAASRPAGDASGPASDVVVKRRRGRPPSLHLQKSAGAKLPSPTSLSPRRQSLRLQKSRGRRPMTPEAARDKMSHRTCQYCGVVKPTPAALLRHIRKHTGERPFVCQVCNKCYKAKRSLHLHQLSHHHELFERDPCNVTDPNSPAIAVLPSTTNLLRETLETRRLARLSESCDPFFGPSLRDGTVVGSVNPHDITAYRHSCVVSKSNLVNGESQTPADHEDSMKMAEGEEADEEEGLDDLTKRSCPYCFKVCPKPSDLKRHLMVHTGERPFRCQVCHKCFKQKGSLLYHQKAAHDLNVELSQGLEERYLRLKTRSAMRSLAALDGLGQQRGIDGFVPFTYGSQDSLHAVGDCSGESLEEDSGGKHLPHHFATRNHATQVVGSSLHNKHSDLYSQTSKIKNGLLEEEVIHGSRIVEIEMFDAKDHSLKQRRRQRLLVTKETLLMSQLDGICLSTGQEETVFKCCICGKVFTSLAQTHSHISSHFDLAGMTFDCNLCSAVFMCKSDVAEHMQVQHGTDSKGTGVGSSNCDFSVVSRSPRLEEELVCEYQRSMKHFGGFDDHNNNNDKLRDKERLGDLHEEDNGNGSDLPVFPSPVVAGVSQEESSDDHARAFPAHCCTVCRKGFTSQYLLQRHMHLHFQQSAYHTAALSAVSGFAAAIRTNGLHRDLLEAALGMSCLGNDREMEEGGDKRATEENKEEEASLGCDKSMKNEAEGRSVACGEDGPGTLENEDIKDDIMVVIPSDPDVDASEISEFLAVGDDGSSDHESQEKETEIRSAPKRSLLPVKKDGPVLKSRRKSSLPIRFDHKMRSIATSSNPLPPPLPTSSPPPRSSSASSHLFSSQILLGTSPHLPFGTSAEALDIVPHGHPPSTPSPHLSCLSDDDTWISKDRGFGSKDDSLLAKQTKYVQSLHASYGRAGFRGNGYPSLSPEAAAAGLVGPFGSPGLPGQQPLSVQVPTATSTPLQGISSPPPTYTLGSRADIEEQVESPSLPSGNHISPSSPPHSASCSPVSALPSPEDQEDLVGYPRMPWLPSMGIKSSCGSPSPPNLSLTLPSSSASRKHIPAVSSSHSSAPAFPLPDKQEDLVGYSQVLWHPSMGSRSPHGTPSPPSVPLTLPSSSSAGGKRMQPVWHTLSSDDLRNAPNTDGRKVTSLSRTHSRLYVVNQPVDRERLCKPTILPDGRTVFRCIFCRKDFLSYSDINRHMDFHEDIRPYKCNFCDYYARTNSQLKVHMMRHQGIREFCCKLCNYKGVTQSDLNRHMKSQIHVLKSRNECHRCGEGFVTAKNLEKHVTSICTGKHKMDIEYEAMAREIT